MSSIAFDQYSHQECIYDLQGTAFGDMLGVQNYQPKPEKEIEKKNRHEKTFLVNCKTITH